MSVYEAISYHPDILLCHAGGNSIVYAPGTDAGFVGELSGLGFKLLEGRTTLKDRYPENIAYNAARVGKYVIHNFKYTDPLLKELFEKEGLDFIHVNQGYAKCSIDFECISLTEVTAR
jgi:hypothetical protein